MAQVSDKMYWKCLDGNDLQYSREDVLGEGGFGLVFLGCYRGNEVAVKRVQLRSTSPDDEREIRLQGKLEHQHVLSILTATKDKDFRYVPLSRVLFYFTFYFFF